MAPDILPEWHGSERRAQTLKQNLLDKYREADPQERARLEKQIDKEPWEALLKEYRGAPEPKPWIIP